MNAYAVVLKPARAALVLLALSIATALAVVIGTGHYRAQKQMSILQAEKRLASGRAGIVALTSDLDAINRLSAKYKKLVQSGFIGEADRDGWVARLEALYRDTQLPPTLRYTLAPPQLLNMQTLPADAPLAYRNDILHHDLSLELSGIHEGELLDFMDRLDARWMAPFRVESCQMSREADTISGLEVKCTIRLFSLPGRSPGMSDDDRRAR